MRRLGIEHARQRSFVRATCIIAMITAATVSSGRAGGLDSVAISLAALLATLWPATAAAYVLIRPTGVRSSSVWSIVGGLTATASVLLLLVFSDVAARWPDGSRHAIATFVSSIERIFWRHPVVVCFAILFTAPVGIIAAPLIRYWLLGRPER